MKDNNGWEIVSTYSTREAVADGFLVKVDSEASNEVGIKFPVYLTRAAWDKYVEVPKGMEQLQTFQVAFGMCCICLLFEPGTFLPTFYSMILLATCLMKVTGSPMKSLNRPKIDSTDWLPLKLSYRPRISTIHLQLFLL